ncbi:olfactory receptor 1020 [Xenopus tropicalis]|uniref:Olfactory receptor n=1 Tax=Xenopus tropicalis TaxID=8364 RepID=A0A8J0QW11_XENTR|nr:olfactory receptor 1020 [Xenopus tropicalis]|eukprot:XP_004911469.1 PREDICTED: olfactory receptor 1020-like [Xenopus tropicalis]
MENKNITKVEEFIFSGLSDNPQLKPYLFILFFIVYTLTLVENSALILVISNNAQLYTPMYEFLRQLSIIDICYSSSVTIKMLSDFVSEKRSISVAGCGLQMLTYAGFGGSECFLLAAMSFDRYVAICHPLTYLKTMNKQTLVILILFCYLGGLLNGIVQTWFSFFHLNFCGLKQYINHFYCDVMALIEISCGNTRANEVVLLTMVGFIELSSLFVILSTYLCIIYTVLGIRSSEGRKKAFSTCASHMTVVSLFYGTIIFMYLRPLSAYRPEEDKIIAVFYTVIIPLLNPIVYSLRNRDVKKSAKKTVCQVKLKNNE